MQLVWLSHGFHIHRQCGALFSQMPITALPSEIISLVLSQLCLVRNIKYVKRTCRAFRDAAPAAEQAHRRVCFVGHFDPVYSVAAAPDGRVITGSYDYTVKL